jgi:hypothetical protein
MSENKLVGSLVLRTIDINWLTNSPFSTAGAIVDNEFGTCLANSQVITWKNVNIRACLGSLYQKYNRFNLKLCSVQFRHNGLPVTDFQFMIYMSGLPFSPSSTYNTKLGPMNSVGIGCVNYFANTTVWGFLSFYTYINII